MKVHWVHLAEEQQRPLQHLLASGEAKARTLTHARILLKADSAPGGPGWTDAMSCEALDVSPATVVRVRKRFYEEGLEAALYPKAQANRKARHFDGAQEAHLIALVCGDAPEAMPVGAFGCWPRSGWS
jgi:hypothetical protein